MAKTRRLVRKIIFTISSFILALLCYMPVNASTENITLKVGESITKTFYCDTPTTSVYISGSPAETSKSDIISTSDFDLRLNSGGEYSWKGSFTITGLAEGEETITVKQVFGTTVFNTYKVNVIANHDHVWIDDYIVAPTCTETGSKREKCQICGKIKENSTQTVEALGHYVIKEEAIEPTCTSEGKTEGSFCSRCYLRFSGQNIIPALGHKWNIEDVIEEATCISPGTGTFVCERCHESKEDLIPQKAHEYDMLLSSVDATCTSNGKIIYICKNCDSTITEVVPCLGHNWDAGVITKPLTCESNEEKTFTCQRCNETRVEVKKTSGHKWDQGIITQEKTCTLDEIKTYHCSQCAKTKTEIKKAEGHKYKSTEIVNPTYNSSGYTLQVCSVCGNENKSDYINPINPSVTKEQLKSEAKAEYDEKVRKVKESNAATRNDAQKKIANLKNQGYWTGTETQYSSRFRSLTQEITRLQSQIASTNDAVQKAKLRLELNKLQEELDEIEQKHSNLIRIQGLEELIDSIDRIEKQTLQELLEKYSERLAEIEAMEEHHHVWGTGIVEKESTCREEGKKKYTCTICKEEKIENMPLLPHTSVLDPAVDATTTSTGLTEGSHCSVCGEVIKKQEVIPKKVETAETDIKEDPNNPSVETQEKKITVLKDNGEPKGSTYRVLSARVKKSAKTSNTLGWNKVKGASGYIIYGNRCGNAYKYKKIAEVKKTSYVHKKLKKGTYYKYIVVAYKNASGKKTVIATSKTMHSATTGGKVGNCKKLKVNKTTITLKRKKTVKIKAKEVAASKKLKIKRHRKIAFESSNLNVATVSKTGKIKGIKKGSCKIYVYAQNGVYKVVKVRVN